MRPVLTVAEMNAVDAAAATHVDLDVLIGRAGWAVCGAALAILGGAYGRRVVVIAGRGHNGADGRVAAALLVRRGARVEVVEAGAAAAVDRCDLIIDAAYGTGFHGRYQAPDVPTGVPVLAVDVPSGIEGDTGASAGSPLTADRTVTFVALKPGLLQGEGVARSGRVEVADIGLWPGDPVISLMEDGDLADLYPSRHSDGNKWSAAVLVVAGSPGMNGAAALCSRAAYRAGAGMVRLGVPGASLSEAPASEAVSVSLGAEGWAGAALEVAARCRAVVVGPGLGRADATASEVRRLVAESPVPVVVDADGLFALGPVSDGPVSSRSTVVLTPHDGEYARLMGSDPGPDRIQSSRRLAVGSQTVALLKGPTTAVASPDERVLLARAGTPALATAGTGDVLSGVIGAMLARGVEPRPAAALAAHIHGRAGARGPGEGLVAGDLPDLVADVVADLRPAGARG